MDGRPQAVFVFTDDGDLMVFPSLADAAGYMEAVDVDSGEYRATYTHDGHVVRADTTYQEVVLAVTDDVAEEEFRNRLLRYRELVAFTSPPEDTVAVANELMRMQWELRWPQRPRWLSRRLHGDRPPEA